MPIEIIVVDVLKNVGLGMFYGGQAALFGYMKDNDLPLSWTAVLTKDFWAKFDPIKSLKTVLLGALLGGVTQGMSVIPVDLVDPVERIVVMNFANTAIIMGIDQFVKFVVRRTPLVRAWNWLKTQFGI
jgi:hypothetical protein